MPKTDVPAFKPTKKQILAMAEAVQTEDSIRRSQSFTLETTNMHVDERNGYCTLALKADSGAIVLFSPSGQTQRLLS